jgi:hypothetical protein
LGHVRSGGVVRRDTQAVTGKAGYRVVFNLTGGFKSVQGFMQALGMIYADESVYVFERTEQLLRLPRLPVQLDSTAILRQHLAVFRRIAAGLPVHEAEVADVPESLVNVLDGQAVFSPWGELVWQEAYRTVYGAELLEPITPKLVFWASISADARRLGARSVAPCQRASGSTGATLGGRVKPIIRASLDFKPLQGTGLQR